MTEQDDAELQQDTICPYCKKDYSDPNGVASLDYMYQGHIIHDCPNPDKMERAYLNAAPAEVGEHWP